MYTKNIFISHSWNYSERYNSMHLLLNNRLYFNWKNFSVPETKKFELNTRVSLENQLKRQINPTHCVIIIGGMWTNHSDWIQFELDYAYNIGKPILGVRPRGAKIMPQSIINKSTEVCNWNSDSIVNAIRRIS